jgi:hypothetical protein
MNHAKIAAALHALADAFLADVEAVETAVTGKKSKKAGPVVAAADAVPAAAPAPAPEIVIEEPAAPPPPSVTLKQVNDAVLKVAAKHRDIAVATLAKFGLTTTVGLPQEKWQPLYDAFEEEIAKIDAAAVLVQQAASLV